MKFNCGKDDLSSPKKKGGKVTQQQSYLRRSARNKSAFHNLDVSHVSGVYLGLIGTIRSSNQVLFRRCVCTDIYSLELKKRVSVSVVSFSVFLPGRPWVYEEGRKQRRYKIRGSLFGKRARFITSYVGDHSFSYICHVNVTSGSSNW